MSTEAVDLCKVLLEEQFGETVAEIGEVLLSGATTLPTIVLHFKNSSKIRGLEVDCNFSV